MKIKNKYLNHLYICDSIYHIYLSILKSRYLHGNHSIFLKDTIANSKDLKIKLNDSGFFSEVKIINELNLLKKKNPFLTVFPFRHFEPLADDFLVDNTKIFFFLDTTLYAKFLIKNYPNMNFILVEEGEQLYAQYGNKFKDLVKKICRLPLGYGRDNQIKTIETQYIDRLDVDRKKKATSFKLKDLELNLSKNEISEIYRVFGYNLELFQKPNLTILLTQPLSEDGLITEKEKILLYKKIIYENARSEQIMIKVHPREKTNYNLHFPNFIITPGHFPIELLNHTSIKISKAITFFSSALNNLKNVNERIFLGIDYCKKVEEKYKSKLGLKFDNERTALK